MYACRLVTVHIVRVLYIDLYSLISLLSLLLYLLLWFSVILSIDE